MIIIGAGPVGCYLGYSIKKLKEDLNILIIDKKQEIGIPLRCSGLVTRKILDLVSLDKSIVKNVFNYVEIYYNDFKKKYGVNKEILLDRIAFDKYLCNLATNYGCKILLNHEVINIKTHKSYFEVVTKTKKGIKRFKTNILVGADGPLSIVNKLIFKNKYKYILGIEFHVKKNIKFKDTYKVYFNKEISHNFFAWEIPSDSFVKIGTGIELDKRVNVNSIINNFKNFFGINNFFDKVIGLIPIFNPKAKIEFKDGNKFCFLVGDSAGQVKATTGGGLYFGMLSSLYLSKVILKIIKPVWRQLNLHLLARKVLNRCNEQELKEIILPNLQLNEREYIKISNLIKNIKFLKFIKYLF